MATIETTQLTNLFEKVIDPMLRKLHIMANKSPLVRMWKEGRNAGEGTKEMANDEFFITTRFGRHSDMQTQPEGATLLRGRTRDAQPSFKTKTLPGSFTFSLKAKRSSDSRAGAIVDTVMNETEGMLERAKSMMAFYANNDGTGVFADLDDASPNAKTTLTIDGIRATSVDILVDPGDSIAIGSAAERLAGSGFNTQIDTVDSLTQLTINSTTVGLNDDDLIYFSEARDTVLGEETSKIGADGLLQTTGTVQNITLATSLFYQAQIDTTTEVIAQSRVLEFLQRTDPRVPDASAFIVTMGDLWFKFVEDLQGTTRVDAERANAILTGGARGLRMEWFGGATPVIFDPYARPGFVFGLDLSNMGYRQMWPLELVADASNLAHRITQKLEFEVVAAEDGNFYVIDPRANFKLTNKTTV